MSFGAWRLSSGQLGDTLALIGYRPAVLASLLMALTALSFPYQGRVHDAALYSFQAVNRLSGGAHSDDLFFKYGSQDRFSAFSTVVAPVARLLGLERTFLLLYLLSAGLLCWACVRISRSLIDDVRLVTLSAILLAVSPLEFGGLGIFRVNEAFFTPRLPACALSLLALDCCLRRRVLMAASLLSIAAVLHPLMAEGAIVVAALWLVSAQLSGRSTAIRISVAGLVAVSGIVAIVITAGRVAVLDDVWREIILKAAPYNFPAEWHPSDWLAVAGSISIVSIASATLRHSRPDVSRLLAAAVLVAAAGLAATYVASMSSHSLLFQIQPYRALWLLAVLQVPCGVFLVANWWRDAAFHLRVAALVVAAYLVRTDLPFVQAELTLVAFLIAVGTTYLLRDRRAVPFLRLASLSVAAGLVGIAVMVWVHLSLQRAELVAEFDPLMYARFWLWSIGPFCWLVAGCAAAIWLVKRPVGGSVVLVCTFVVVSALAVWIPTIASYRAAFTKDAEDRDFVQTFLEHQPARNSPPTLYMDWGGAADIWVELRANSYFQLTQIVGVMFSRRTGVESLRRAGLVAPFEAARYSETRKYQPEVVRLMTDSLFGPHPGEKSLANLKRLCADELLDFAILKKSTIPADAITNGGVRIYDCRQLRAGPALPK